MFKEYKTIDCPNFEEHGAWINDPVGTALTKAAKEGYQFVSVLWTNNNNCTIIVGRSSIPTVLFKKD